MKSFLYGNIGAIIQYYKKKYWKRCLETKKVLKFLNCGPQIAFRLLKLNVRPEQCFEFDVPDLKHTFDAFLTKSALIFKGIVKRV
jgi:hypothetical protein